MWQAGCGRWFHFQFVYIERRLRERSLREEGNTGVSLCVALLHSSH